MEQTVKLSNAVKKSQPHQNDLNSSPCMEIYMHTRAHTRTHAYRQRDSEQFS
jgi:hypothetical protein